VVLEIWLICFLWFACLRRSEGMGEKKASLNFSGRGSMLSYSWVIEFRAFFVSCLMFLGGFVG